MLRPLFILVAMTLAGCPKLPPPDGCTPRSSTCLADRPYVCSASQRWTPVGDTTCAEAGGVCCATTDARGEIHACVLASACEGP